MGACKLRGGEGGVKCVAIGSGFSRTALPSRGSYLSVHFCHSCDVLMSVICLVRMWMSAVGEGPCSTQIFEVHDRRAIRRLLTPPPVRSLSHDPCSRTTNCLSTLWTARKVICWYASFSTHLNCRSRDSLTCEHMVRNWCDIAFLTEHIRTRSP